MNFKAFVIGFTLSVLILSGVAALGVWYFLKTSVDTNITAISPLAKMKLRGLTSAVSSPPLAEQNPPKSVSGGRRRIKEAADAVNKTVFEKDKIINILLIGIDRRNKSQTGFNTDIMVLVSVNPTTNRVLLTSVPRDLWVNGNKINALYTVNGHNSLLSAFEQITGQAVSGYIMSDFEDLKWLVDAFGGVPVDVQRTFTDFNFPNNSDTAVVTVTFTEGREIMSGERALTFARSRKGTNGEGSDLMRAKRQHLILQGLVEAVSRPGSKFWPMDIKTFYAAATSPTKMVTTLNLDDVYYLWDFYKDKDKYSVESFVIGDEYIYHPGTYPESSYHAWVFVPRGSSWTKLHQDIANKLEGTFTEEAVDQATETN